MRRILIKNGTLVNADKTFHADIAIEGEKISAIGDLKNITADDVFDASNKLIFPGAIDVHTHMELPLAGTISADSFESGTRAALHGGTTTIIDYAMQSKGERLKEGLDRWQQRAAGSAVCDYSFHLGVVQLNSNILRELPSIITTEGISSFKGFTAYKDIMLQDQDIKTLMKTLTDHGGMLCLHCEAGQAIEQNIKNNRSMGKLHPKYHAASRPANLEREAIASIAALAREVGHRPYVVHLSSADGLAEIQRCHEAGQQIYAETCPQYLILDDSLYEAGALQAASYVLSPPLRPKSHQSALWQGIKNGLIQTIATDHCPFNLRQKSLGLEDFSKVPNGLPGVENRFELMYTKGVLSLNFSLNRLVELTSTMPAKLFGLFPRKGLLAKGSDADLIIFDPSTKQRISAKTHHMNCDYSAYEGIGLNGKCELVFLRGQLVIDSGKALVKKGYGNFLKRGPAENYLN